MQSSIDNHRSLENYTKEELIDVIKRSKDFNRYLKSCNKLLFGDLQTLQNYAKQQHMQLPFIKYPMKYEEWKQRKNDKHKEQM